MLVILFSHFLIILLVTFGNFVSHFFGLLFVILLVILEDISLEILIVECREQNDVAETTLSSLYKKIIYGPITDNQLSDSLQQSEQLGNEPLLQYKSIRVTVTRNPRPAGCVQKSIKVDQQRIL